MTSNAPLNFGFIGLGAGAMNMIPELRANPNARIVAVADPRSSARERVERDFGGRAYDDAEGLCADPDSALYRLANARLSDRHRRPKLQREALLPPGILTCKGGG